MKPAMACVSPLPAPLPSSSHIGEILLTPTRCGGAWAFLSVTSLTAVFLILLLSGAVRAGTPQANVWVLWRGFIAKGELEWAVVERFREDQHHKGYEACEAMRKSMQETFPHWLYRCWPEAYLPFSP
jgi:hypothetical protein